MKNLMDNRAMMYAITEPMASVPRLDVSVNTAGCSLCKSQRLLIEAANIVGTAKKKENSAATLLESF